MTLLEFSKKFPTEKSCRLHFKSVRDKEGVIFKKCGDKVQNYLNEFMYKLNRRYFKEALFDRLLITSVFNYG